MRVVVAMDSFKGSLSSEDLGLAVEAGINKVYDNSTVVKLPIADGGEGTVEALVRGTNGEFVNLTVNGPLMNSVDAKYGILGDGKRAVIEMATASGLPLIKREERNPMLTTTFGTGQLIADALKRGCREFIVGIGGSATNDAGMGMLQALGYKFYDKEGKQLETGCGQLLSKVARVDKSDIIEGIEESTFLVACDVDNPFYGERGAAHVYSRQKGADDQMVLDLDKNLEKFSDFILESEGKDIKNLAGAGAAGGLGGGFVAFLNATLKPGIDIVLEAVGVEEYIKDADFVITGEGRIDFQSVMGKAPTGVSKLAKKHNVPCIGLAGCIADDATEVHNYGINALFSTINYPISLADAMAYDRAKLFVEKNTEEVFRLIQICQKKYSK